MKKIIILFLALSPLGAFAQTTTPVYESFNEYTDDQLITLTYGEAAPDYEPLSGVNFYVPAEVTQDDMYTLYRCDNNSTGHFVSVDSDCEGSAVEGVYGYGFSTQVEGTVALNRYFRTYFNRYFVTPQVVDYPDTYVYQGVLAYVYPGQVVGLPPIVNNNPNPPPRPPFPIPFPIPGPQPQPPHPQPGPGGGGRPGGGGHPADTSGASSTDVTAE